MNRILALFAIGVFTPFAVGQTDTAAILNAYKTDRVEAAKRFPTEFLTAADTVAARAEATIKSNPSLAARLARDARWQLPYAPPGLPEHVSRIMGSARLRHSSRVNAIAYSPNGQSLASVSLDGSMKLWDLASGREILNYRGLADLGPNPASEKEPKDDQLKVASVAFSKLNVIACGGYGEIHLIEASTGKVLQILKGHKGTVKALAFRKDGLRLASVGDDKSIRLWDPATGKELLKFEPAQSGGSGNNATNFIGRFEAIAYSPKGDQIAVTDQNGILAVFDVSGKEAKLKMGARVVNQASTVHAVKYTPDGTGLFTAGESSSPPRLTAGPAPDTAAVLPSAGVAPAVRTFNGHQKRVVCLDVSPDGTLLVTGSEDNTCRVWEANTAKSLKVFSAHSYEVLALAIRPDGKEVASADESGVIRVWPLGSVDEHSTSNEAMDVVWSIAISPSGAKYAAAGADRMIRVYDSTTGELLQTLKGHQSAITTLTFLNDDSLASGGGDRTAYIWNLKSDSTPRPIAGHKSVVLSMISRQAGKQLITGSADRTVKLWDVATGKVIASYDAKSAVSSVSATREGTRIVIGTLDGWVTLLDVTDSGFKRISSTAAHSAGTAAVAIRPDGREVVSVGGDGLVRVWTFGANDEFARKDMYEATINPNGNIAFLLSCATYSPDGKFFAVAGQEGLIRIYDVNLRRETRALRGHSDWISNIVYAPDSKTVISAGVDQIVRRFPLGESEIAAVPGHAKGANCVAVSPDGKTAVTIGESEWKQWDLQSGKELATVAITGGKPNSAVFVNPNTLVIGGEGQKLRWYDLATGKMTKAEPVGQSIYSLQCNGPNPIGIWQQKLDSTEFLIWKGEKFSESFPLPGPEKAPKNVLCAAIAPDTTFALAAQASKNVMVIDLTARKTIGGDWPLYDGSPVDIALTADKSTAICIDDAGQIKIAKIESRTVTAKAKAHPKGCNGIILARTGDRFATLGVDGEVKAWDLNAKELRTWTLPVEVKAAAFTPDGRSIVTANGDGSAYVLAVP